MAQAIITETHCRIMAVCTDGRMDVCSRERDKAGAGSMVYKRILSFQFAEIWSKRVKFIHYQKMFPL